MELKSFLNLVIQSPLLHAKFLNTLSYMENCGARMIAKCEHPRKVKAQMLKHAAEEFRHAHYLKQQIKKVSDQPFENYDEILGEWSTRHYLRRLESNLLRFVSKERSYLLVTYAIEVRARCFYPIYHEALKELGSTVTVRSILLEEEEHLSEIESELCLLPHHEKDMMQSKIIEEKLYNNWLLSVQRTLPMLDVVK